MDWNYNEPGISVDFEHTKGGTPGLNLFVKSDGERTAANLSPKELDSLADYLAQEGYGSATFSPSKADELARFILGNAGSTHAEAGRLRLKRWLQEARNLLPDDDTRRAVEEAAKRCGV